MRENMIFNPSIYQLRESSLKRMLAIINNQKNVTDNQILFFGDSIFEFRDVKRYFPNNKIINCGIAGATSDELLWIIDEAVIKYHPQKVFIHVGTNDLGNTTMHSPRKIAENIALIVEIIQRNLLDCSIYIISPLPCIEEQQAFPNVNGIRSNAFLKYIFQILPEYISDDKITMIDIFAQFYKDGQVNTDLYKDGLHPSDQGYQVMAKNLKKYLH